MLALMATLGLVSDLVAGTAAGTLVPQTVAFTSSKETALKRALFEMREAIDRYYLDHKRYPENLKTLQKGRYIARIPRDPFTGRNSSWRPTRATLSARGRRQRVGIYDVKSGSKRTALDGTRYSDW